MRFLVLVPSVLLATLLFAVWSVSFWRSVGWLRSDEAWVLVPASGMQELHANIRVWAISRGGFEASRTAMVNSVVPAGSAAADEPIRKSQWMSQAASPARERPWDDRWHVSRWNEWRFGNLGWYETAGGGSVSRVFSFPLWMLIAIVGVPWWMKIAFAAQTRWRRKFGYCIGCGYDRNGIEKGLPCPECGSFTN